MTRDLTAKTLRFGYGKTKLGLVLVAQSDRGVAAILLGEDRPRLRREMADAFPDVPLIEDKVGLAGAVAKVVTLVDAPHLGMELPLDLRGSELEVGLSGRRCALSQRARPAPMAPLPR